MSKMHTDELIIDSNLVHRLIQNQCPEWNDLPLSPILSSGTDHTLFQLGNKYLVRLPRIHWAAVSTDKEYAWVPQIAPLLQTAVSMPVFKGTATEFYPYSWLILKWNEGINPNFETGDEYELLAEDLAHFLNDFHKIPLINGPISRRGVALKEVDGETKLAIQQLKDDIDIDPISILWDQLSNLPVWQKDPVWIHGDFLPGNILVQNNRLNAVIDFSDLGMGDPACDFITAWSLFNAKSRNIFKNSLEEIDEITWQRGRGWALSIAVIMLPYYKNSNPTLAALARRMINNVLKGVE